MSFPIDLKKILGDVSPDAHAQLNATFGSPIGETHLVVIDGQLRVFTRESLIGAFEEVEMDPAHPPRLESGGFSDTLHVALRGGESYDFNVGSFERDNVVKVLDSMGATDQPVADTPSEPKPAEQSHAERFKDHAPYEQDDVLSKEPSAAPENEYEHDAKGYESADSQDYAVRENDDYGASDNEGYTSEDSDDYDTDDDGPDGDEVAGGPLFRSNDPGCFGCIMQLILATGAVVGFWFLHVLAMSNAEAFFGWDRLDREGGIWVVTKIVSLICGAYVGGKASGVITKIAKAQLWGGGVLFKDGLVVVFGPKSKWNKRFHLKDELVWECRWYTGSSGDSKEAKKSYHIAVDIRQQSTSVTLRTTFSAKQVNLHVKNMTYTQLEAVPSNDGTVTLDSKTFRKVIKKIAIEKNWQA